MSQLHKYNKNAFSIYNFMSASDCHAHIALTEKIGFSTAKINDGISQAVDKNIRNNQRIIHDDPALAKELWEQIKPYIPTQIEEWEACGLNERFRYYKYEKYQTFKWHRDLAFKRNDKEMSKLTFLIYLNDNFEGGFTDFEDFKVWPSQGMVVCFHHKLRHEGAIVSHGTKYVLRSDVMFKRK